MNATLAAWNKAEKSAALDVMLACCGAKRWASAMTELRPFGTPDAVIETADHLWSTMQERDLLEAFASHPRIGARKENAGGQSAEWSSQEQSQVSSADSEILAELDQGNQLYETLFGFTYIVCATGKSPEELLAILKQRLGSTREAELQEAAEQQRQILQIRLRKWLAE